MALTIKQEKFAQKFFELGNASAAYRAAYDAENMQAETIWQEASRLAANPQVAARVEQLRKASERRSAVTVESLVEELEEVRAAAMGADQNAAAVAAIMGKAKLLGLEVNKADVTTRHEGGKPDLAGLLAQVRASAASAASSDDGTESVQPAAQDGKDIGDSVA